MYIYCILYIHESDDYSVIKMKEILSLATALMDLEGVMLSEVSQTEKDQYYGISLICGLKQTNKLRNRTDCQK